MVCPCGTSRVYGLLATCGVRSADWVELALATGGEPFLKTNEHTLSWPAAHSLDVAALLAAAGALFMFLIFLGARAALRAVRPGGADHCVAPAHADAMGADSAAAAAHGSHAAGDLGSPLWLLGAGPNGASCRWAPAEVASDTGKGLGQGLGQGRACAGLSRRATVTARARDGGAGDALVYCNGSGGLARAGSTAVATSAGAR